VWWLCSIDAFEYTQELAAFDSLGILLVHGWLLDPEASKTVRVEAGAPPPMPPRLFPTAARRFPTRPHVRRR
jgi:hypothetical protein